MEGNFVTMLKRPESRAKQPKPFLKWAGGKQRLLRQYEPFFPHGQYEDYHEPFLGGAAVFFYLCPEKKAFLTDLNPELINVYLMVRDRCDEVIEAIKSFGLGREEYYRIRALDPEDLTTVERAARTIYLNRTCYNGLYRVNQKGHFNVPYGRYEKPSVLREGALTTASKALKRTEIFIDDFSGVLKRAKPKDLVYMDPPYHPKSRTANFTGYTQGAFNTDEQERLAEVYRALDARGCKVILSNSDTPFIHDLYSVYRRETVLARRSINRDREKRGDTRELLILNY